MSGPPKSLMITNLGRACGRVLRNIQEYHPDAIVYLKQKDPGWNERDNPSYGEAVKQFLMHPLIEKHQKQGTLMPKELTSVTKYPDLFDSLADLIEENVKYSIVYLDCTGLPKLGTIVALHLAGIYEHVFPIYNQSKLTREYDPRRDDQYRVDDGKGPEYLPFTKIDIRWVENPEGSAGTLLLGAFSIAQERGGAYDVRFTERDLSEKLQQLSKPLGGIQRGVGMSTLLSSGLFARDLTRTKSYVLTLPGFALARRLFGASTNRTGPGANRGK